MPLEPELAAHLQLSAAFPAVPISDLAAYRKATARSARALPRRDLPLSGKRDLSISTPGTTLPARLYMPPDDGPGGLLLYFHGGAGRPRTWRPTTRSAPTCAASRACGC